MDDKLLNKKRKERELRKLQQKNPFSLEKCEIHRKTSLLGKPVLQSKVCQCCGLKYQKEELSCNFKSTDLYYLGSGFALYFTFIKVVIIIIFVTSLSFSAGNLYLNYFSNSCLDSRKLINCSSSIYLQLSVANKLTNLGYLQLQAYLADGTIIIIFILIQISRIWMRNILVKADLQLDASDYAVMLNMPNSEFNKNDIIQSIANWWKIQYEQLQKEEKQPFTSFNSSFPIQNVILSYELSQYDALIQQQQTLAESLKQKSNLTDFKPSQRLSQISSKISNKDLLKNNKCIVIFRYPDQKQYFIQKHQRTIINTLFSCWFNLVKFQQERIRITKPALPTQINWSNHQMKTFSKFLWRFLVKVLSLALIVGAEIGIYGLLQYWFNNKTKTTSILSPYISPLISVAINLINIILYKILIFLSKYEYRPTSVEQKVSITVKITISVFLNSGIMLLAAYFILDMTSIWTEGGFVQTLSYSFLIAIIMPHIMQYFNFKLISESIHRSYIRCTNNQDRDQLQTNQIFQRTNVELYEKYAWIINMIWWSSIFAPLIPIAYPCACISLFIHFWSEKFQYTTMLKEPKPFGSYLNNEMIILLQMMPLFLAVGNLGLNVIIIQMNHQAIQPGPLFFDLIGVGVSVIIFFFPSEQLSRLIECMLCLQVQENKKNIEYSVAQKQFITNYQLQNPVYRQKAILKRNSALNKLKEAQVNILKNMGDEKHPIKQYNSKTRVPIDDTLPYPTKVIMKPQDKKTILIPILQIPRNKEIQMTKLNPQYEKNRF